jgi:hypothetical protein
VGWLEKIYADGVRSFLLVVIPSFSLPGYAPQDAIGLWGVLGAGRPGPLWTDRTRWSRDYRVPVARRDKRPMSSFMNRRSGR